MDFLNRKKVKKIGSVIEKFQISLAIAFVGLAFIGVGLALNNVTSNSEQPEFIDSEEGSDEKEKLTIDISGAVKKPGVYNFQSGTRILEAIEKAGGFSKKADKDWVAQNLNLAAKISDGEKVFIPAVGKAGTTDSGSVAGQITGKISINTATESQLDTLPGIGPVRAGKIISNRPYSSINELLNKKVLGEGTFEKIKDKISVY